MLRGTPEFQVSAGHNRLGPMAYVLDTEFYHGDAPSIWSQTAQCAHTTTPPEAEFGVPWN